MFEAASKSRLYSKGKGIIVEMGVVEDPLPVMAVCAMTSRYEAAFDWALEQYRSQGCEVAVRSQIFDFDMTNYYEAEMGSNLKKLLVGFTALVDPTLLPDWKLQSNIWEGDFLSLSSASEPRPLNLDPGYVTQAKLILATTKDRDHRIYLRDGIYAEVTMTYYRKHWTAHRWTYPDYQSEIVVQFLNDARDRYRELLGKWSCEP